MTRHHYSAHIEWQGTTGAGYGGYSRTHTATAPPAAQQLSLSADPAFRGDADLLDPEQLLVTAASSCQLLSFLAVAAQAGLDVLSYEDAATAVLDTGSAPPQIAEIRLAPMIRVAPGTDHEKVRAAAATAHRGCYIANTLKCPVQVEVTVIDA
ncbi:OsmC family protein [Rhodococcus sp. DT1]|uniref:OsmC family protein n=1 Tax=Rhodococcus sp. DT1 TaxID=3416544 RepID=UPI003CEC8956